MTHILDNPIWHALNTSNKAFACGSEHVKYIKRDVGFFAGLKTNQKEDLIELNTLLPSKSFIILFTPAELSIPNVWRIKLQKPLLQMVFKQNQAPAIDRLELKVLEDKDIPAMLALTALTNPGPFLNRTIDFGNYEGVFHGDQLVAMTGQRLQPDPYTEVSAVCTHPNHLGKGYAAELVSSQIRKIKDAARIPFLHLYEDNIPALKLYEKLGFKTRKKMLVYALEN